MVLKKIIVSNPDDTDTRVTLGEFYYNTAEYEKASAIFDEMLKIDPINLEALNFKGLIYVEQKNYDKAIECYKKALETDPEDSIVWDNLGVAYQSLKKFEKAVSAHSKALELEPDDTEIQKNLSYAYLDSQKKELRTDDSGKVLDNTSLSFLIDAIFRLVRKDFLDPVIQANLANTGLLGSIAKILEEAVPQLELFYGFNAINKIIMSVISKTKTSIYLLLPYIAPEILTKCVEMCMINENVKITIAASWDIEVYGKIITHMLSLGNFEVRQLMVPSEYLCIFKDDDDFILAPIIQDMEKLVCLKSTHKEFINFCTSIIKPIYQAQSRPIQ